MQCLEPIKIYHEGLGWHKVPCGKCGFCLQSKRVQWMFRIHWEIFHQENRGWFLTFTYDEKHVKRTADGRLSLRFRDIQLFIKRLRKAGYYAKYICVGEYGAKTKRPHYHMLLWTNSSSKVIDGLWSTKKGVPLGTVHYGRISMRSAMYTLKYIINPKQKQEDGIEKTRAQFSHGLGLAYLTTRVYEYHTDNYEDPVLVGRIDGQQLALPRYYRYKIFTKYQRRKEASLIKSKMLKEETKQFRELRAKGVKRIRPYLQSLRVDQALRILKDGKYGLTI